MNEITLQQKVDRLKLLTMNEVECFCDFFAGLPPDDSAEFYSNVRETYCTYRAMLNDYSPDEAAKFDADFDAEAKKYIEENE